MTKYFKLYWNDIGFEAQQEMIEECFEKIYQDLEAEAKDWKDYAEEITWQERICREYNIDDVLWNNNDEFTQWDESVREYATEEVEDKLSRQVQGINIEVEI